MADRMAASAAIRSAIPRAVTGGASTTDIPGSCYNPDQAERDAAIRARLVAQLEESIAGSDTLTAAESARIESSLAGKPGLERFLRVTPGGLLRLDKAKASAEENLDSKYRLFFGH